MNFFQRINIVVRRIFALNTSYLAFIGIGLFLSAALILSIFAVGHFSGIRQAKQQKSESTQAVIAVKPIVDSSAASETQENVKPSINTNAPKQSVASIPPVEHSSNPIRAAVAENPIQTRKADFGKPLSNLSLTKIIPDTKDNDEDLSLVSMNNGAQEFSFGGDLITRAQKDDDKDAGDDDDKSALKPPLHPGIASDTGKPIDRKPVKSKLTRAGRSFDGDLRALPYVRPVTKERPERGEPAVTRGIAGKSSSDTNAPELSAPDAASAGVPAISAPAPAATLNFDGLDREHWGAGSPPDTNGDVGPNHYIQTVNTSVGIYNKANGALITAFTFNTLMSQGNFGNLCDTDNFGDPVVLYDTFEDRWVLTDFAFKLDGSGNVVNPPGSFQCFAVSKTSDPVAGGWNFYSINTTGGLGDYPKFGIWTDGIYMTASMFDYPAGGAFQNPRAYAFNKAQMYAGAPTVQVVSFNLPATDFTVIPSNARLQTGTPAPGTPNYYVSTWQFTNALSVYKFHVDWKSISLSTFSDATVPIAATSWPNANVANAPQSGTANTIDTLQIRAMMQNQYTNIGGVESLWNTHTIRRANTTGFAAPRWYQLNVNGGTISSTISQATTWDPDGANILHRFMPSLAVDRAGNMALGYSTSSSTTFPSIKYAGRLSTDPVNTFSQTEQTLFAGTASQTGTVTRWGDYSAMSVDPNGCTFWFTTQYANPDLPQTGSNRWKTRIGSFQFAECTPVGNGGTISGTVTETPGGAPIGGATVSLGSRTTTTDSFGNYSFSVPAGTYPNETASFPGYNSSTVNSIIVNDNETTTQNFSLSTAQTNACFTDTSQADFQYGVTSNTELTTSPGDVKLSIATAEGVDQNSSPAALSTTNNLSATTWTGQTFRAGITGNLTKITVGLGLASGTSGTITVEIRDLNGSNPGTTVLATGTLGPVTNVGTAALYTTTFATPAAVVSGTSYSVVLRNSVGNTVFGVRGSTAGGSTLANGQVFTTTNSGTTWTAVAADLYFKTYVTPPSAFNASGNFVSGVKDANPANGATANWGTISWTATTPAGTDVKFQAAASNNAAGVFNFVGPDGTANTYFTNGGSLAQFNGFRYLKYKAILTGTSTATPTLSDVTICFADQQATTLTVNSATGTYGGTVNLSATLTAAGSPVSGKSVDFKLNSISKGSATTDSNGVATLSNVSLAGINAGNYPSGVSADFAAESLFGSSTATNSLTVNQVTTTITWNNPADITYGTALSGTQLNATASTAGSFVYTPAAGTVLNAGNSQTLHVDFTPTDTTNYTSASKDVSINVLKANQTITFGALAGKTYGDAPFTVSASASSNLTVSFSAAGNCSVSDSTVTITSAGSCTITASQAGDSNYNAAESVSQSFSISEVTTTITWNNPADITYGTALSGTQLNATASVAGSLVYNPAAGTVLNAGNSQTLHVDFTPTDTTNYTSASKDVSINVLKANQTITFGALAGKTYGDAPFTVSATGGSSGNAVTFSASGNCSSSGTNGSTITITGAGSCTVTASQNGNANFNAAAPVGRSFNIVKAILNVTANNLSRPYNTPNPTLTVSYTGFVNNETLATSGVTGSPVLSTTAVQSSPVGSYPISIALGSLSSANYQFNLVGGTLTVNLSGGVVGLTNIDLGANKGFVDSFNSAVGYAGSKGSQAEVLTNGLFSLKTSNVFGNVTSTAGSVELRKKTTISGNVSYSTTLQNDGTIQGTTTHQTYPAYAASIPAVCTPNSSTTGISGSFTYDPVTGILTIADGKSATLAAGNYCFNSITLSGSGSLSVNGQVVIRLNGKLITSNRIINSTMIPANLQISTAYTGSGGVELSGNNSYYMVIYAPGTDVSISGGMELFGAVLGKTLTLSGNAAIHHDTNISNLWAVFQP